MKTKLEEHEVIAYCSAFLLLKKAKINNIAVKKQHIPQVKKIILRSLLKNKIDKKLANKIISLIKFNKSKEDILGTYYHGRKYPNRRIVIEAKGGNVMYGIYTVLGQLICSRESSSSYWWFGFACPKTWAKFIYNKMISKGKIKPIIDSIIRIYTRKGQGLNFYFVDEKGDIESITWRRFLSRNRKH